MSRGPARQMFQAVCAQCGQDTEVPFEPRQGRPVYCSNCYNRVKGGR
jgi:CxxC-x17-CxxC domain-containing protein